MKSLIPAVICAAAGDTSARYSEVNAVSLGTNMNLVVPPSERDRVRAFYRDVLGCRVTRASERIDKFEMRNGFYLGVVYADGAQSEEERRRSIWLELRTDHPEALRERILEFGARQIDFWDEEHFYFQAPGGQVYRLVGTDEDMTQWQR